MIFIGHLENKIQNSLNGNDVGLSIKNTQLRVEQTRTPGHPRGGIMCLGEASLLTGRTHRELSALIR